MIAAGFDQVDATSQPAAAAAPAARPAVAPRVGGDQQRMAGAATAGLGAWSQQRAQNVQAVPADSGFDVDLPAIVEPDLSAGRSDDLDVPDFLK